MRSRAYAGAGAALAGAALVATYALGGLDGALDGGAAAGGDRRTAATVSPLPSDPTVTEVPEAPEAPRTRSTPEARDTSEGPRARDSSVAPRASASASTSSRSAARVPRVDDGWVRRTAEAVGIPAAAVRAYGRAVLGAPKGCELGWTTLAGIGWVESQHGTMDGRTLGDDGHADTPVVGPALDGREGFAAIRASERSTVLHGDPVWDRAVGPMQFIPSTWARWARDGDGDGVLDPHDIDDAAVSAAAYLCHDSRDLTTSQGWNAAIFSYNHDNAYVVAVHAAANRYGQLAR